MLLLLFLSLYDAVGAIILLNRDTKDVEGLNRHTMAAAKHAIRMCGRQP